MYVKKKLRGLRSDQSRLHLVVNQHPPPTTHCRGGPIDVVRGRLEREAMFASLAVARQFHGLAVAGLCGLPPRPDGSANTLCGDVMAPRTKGHVCPSKFCQLRRHDEEHVRVPACIVIEGEKVREDRAVERIAFHEHALRHLDEERAQQNGLELGCREAKGVEKTTT